jgi:hypothetical protein
MAIAACRIEGVECEGGTLEKLAELIELRSKALQESGKDAVIATGINILTSLKASTKKAPLKGRRKMYTLERTNLVAGWERRGKLRHRVVRSGEGGHIDRNVTAHCRNLAGRHYVKGERIHVYKAQLFNENLNNTLYYAFAKDEKTVRRYIEEIILGRLLKKESGMARYTIGIAQAKASSRPMNTPKPTGSKAFQIAHAASVLDIRVGGYNSGEASLSFHDQLKYSADALRGGAGEMNSAIMKAANKTAGLIHMAFVNKRFDQDVKTPFPEVQRKR